MRTQKTTLCLSIRNWSAVNIYTSSTANEEEEKREMFREMQAEIRTLQNDVEKAKTTNKELIHYTEHPATESSARLQGKGHLLK